MLWILWEEEEECRDGFALGQALVLEPHQRLFLHVVVELVDGVEVLFQTVVIYARFADRAVSEAKGDAWSVPELLEDGDAAVGVEDVAADFFTTRERVRGD